MHVSHGRLSKKIQSAQNKCIRFYLNLINTAHVGATEFKPINWLPTKHREEQNICTNIMKFFNGTAPAYADEIFHPAEQSQITRRSKFRLNVPFRRSSTGQKCLSYQGPQISNSLASDLKPISIKCQYIHLKLENIDNHKLFQENAQFSHTYLQKTSCLATGHVAN